ncbi:2279_t:CDS:1, partial [Racocetra persica]
SSKSANPKSQDINASDQNIITDFILTDLINNIVEHANRLSSNMPLYSNYLRVELQKQLEPELQEPEFAFDFQEF